MIDQIHPTASMTTASLSRTAMVSAMKSNLKVLVPTNIKIRRFRHGTWVDLPRSWRVHCLAASSASSEAARLKRCPSC